MTVNKEEAAMLLAFVFFSGFVLGMIFRAKQVKTIPLDQCIVSQDKLNEFIKTNKVSSGLQIQICTNIRVP